MKKILCVVGTTGVGKTELALHLATLLKGDLISVDSRQVYKSLDIISGKDLPKESKFVLEKKISDFYVGYYKTAATRLYLVDVVSPSHSFSVSDFIQLIPSVIESIIKRGRLPILVGGTGFYFKAFLDGIPTINIPINKKLRIELVSLSSSKLLEILKKEDADRFGQMNQSDRANPRRLIRVIEVARWRKTSKRDVNKVGPLSRTDLAENGYDFLVIGLQAPKEILKQKIDQRVEGRLKQGALEEARKLFRKYHTLSEQVKSADGYHALFEYLLGKLNLGKAIDQWRLEEYHHAKNQMTWFRKDKRIRWFDIADFDFRKNIDKIVLEWYSTN